jgi:hypothetical protein
MVNMRVFKENRVRIITILFIFLFVLMLNCLGVYYVDDWHFKFVFYGEHISGLERRIASLKDIIISARNYYCSFGGRILAHSILFCVLMADKWVFNILNSLVFVSLGLNIEALIGARKYKLALPVIYSCMLLLLPEFGDCVLWVSGAVNYLWMALLFTVCLRYTDRYIRGEGNIFFMCLLCLAAAMANEVSGGMLLIIYLLKSIVNGRCRSVLPALFIMVGIAVVVAAPGNSVRRVSSAFNAMPLYDCIVGYGSVLARYLPSILISVARLTAEIRRGKPILKAICERSCLIGGICGVAALPLSGGFVSRATFLGVILILIGAGKDIQATVPYLYNNGGRIIKTMLIPVGLAIWLFIAYNVSVYVDGCKIQHDKIKCVKDAAERGEECVTYHESGYLPQGLFMPASQGGNFTEYTDEWMGLYYNIKIKNDALNRVQNKHQ